MANQFSEEQRKHILLAFNQLDKDADGKLSPQEVTQLIKDMDCGYSPEDIQKLISECDADNSGTIEAGEFLALMARMMLTITSEEHILESFSILKGDGQQVITFDSLKETLAKMGDTKISDDDIRNMIEQADLENKGKVTLQEFKKLLMRWFSRRDEPDVRNIVLYLMDPKIVESELRNHKIREGPIYKRTKFLQDWRQRWMVLTMNYVLIFTNRNLKELAEFIDLKEVKTYKSYLRKEEDMIPAGFKVRTIEEMFYFCARNCNQKWTWLVSIERVMDFKYAGKSPYNNAEWIKTKGFMGQRQFERGKFDQPEFQAPPQPQKPKEMPKPVQQVEVKTSSVNEEQLKQKMKKLDEEIERLKQKEEEMHDKERQQEQIFLFELNKLKKTEESLKQLQIQLEERARQVERAIQEGGNNRDELKGVIEKAEEEARNSDQIRDAFEQPLESEKVEQSPQIQKTEEITENNQAPQNTEQVEQKPSEEKIESKQQKTQENAEKPLPMTVSQTSQPEQSPNKPQENITSSQMSSPGDSPSSIKKSSAISKKIEDMKNFFESKGTVMRPPSNPVSVSAKPKDPKKVKKQDQGVNLNMCRDKIVVNLLEEFHSKAYNYGGLRYIIEFLVTICAERNLGYQSFLIREAKANQNRFLFAEVLLELINDYKKYDNFVCIARIVQVLIFQAPGIFKLNHYDLIKRKLVDLVNHAPEDHSDMPTLLKTLYVVHKMKNLEKDQTFKAKLTSIMEKMISIEGKNWARKLIDDL